MAKEKGRRISRGGVWHILVGHPFFQVKKPTTWFPCFLAQFPVYLTIIPLMLDGYEMIIPNNHLTSNKRERNNYFI